MITKLVQISIKSALHLAGGFFYCGDMAGRGRPRKTNKSLEVLKKKTGGEVSKFDVYLDCLNGTKDWDKLTKVQAEMYDKYSLAWSMANIGRTDDMIEAALMKKFDIKQGMARIIRIESFELFGSVNDVSKQGRKVAAINYFKTLSNLARSEKDYKTSKEAWKEASVLEGLYEEEIQGWDKEKFNIPTTIIFSTNTAVLQKQRKEVLEDDE